jgi:hypothetical protein
MNYRVRLLPISELRGLQTSQDDQLRITPSDWENAKLFRSFTVYDFDFEPTRYSGRDSLLGLLLALGIGAGFWTAAGLLIARLW